MAVSHQLPDALRPPCAASVSRSARQLCWARLSWLCAKTLQNMVCPTKAGGYNDSRWHQAGIRGLEMASDGLQEALESPQATPEKMAEDDVVLA